MFRIIFFLFLCIFTVSCEHASRPSKANFRVTDFAALNGWEGQTDMQTALKAFERSCKVFSRMPQEKALLYPSGTVGDWAAPCRKIESVRKTGTSQAAKQFFGSEFVPVQVFDNDESEGLFTGYYEPQLKGSLRAHGRYTEPVYKRPSDLRKPFLTRKEINKGALSGRGLELAYVDDPVALFFLQIQGSGRIELDDGKVLRVGYHDQNGRDYYSIGRHLIDIGEMEREEVTAPLIKKWLRDHPDRMRDVMERNESYVFFRRLSGEDGPIGAQGIPVTPERSLAVDKRFISYGVPVWLETTLPDIEERGEESLYRRLLVAQDTGGAIKGAVRGDVFFGHGDRAEKLAGHMKQPGRYYILIPKALASYVR